MRGECHNGSESTVETAQEKYERLRQVVQEAILNDYPNPDRVGCPKDATIQEVAVRDALTKDAVWEHITHCSPCYGMFLEHKARLREGNRGSRDSL